METYPAAVYRLPPAPATTAARPRDEHPPAEDTGTAPEAGEPQRCVGWRSVVT